MRFGHSLDALALGTGRRKWRNDAIANFEGWIQGWPFQLSRVIVCRAQSDDLAHKFMAHDISSIKAYTATGARAQ